MSHQLLDGEAHGVDRIKSIDVPGLGLLELHMRYRDRRAGRGYASISPRDGIKGGYALVRNYGKRRTVLLQWEDDNGTVRTIVFGPIPGLRGRASPRYGAGDMQTWVSL